MSQVKQFLRFSSRNYGVLRTQDFYLPDSATFPLQNSVGVLRPESPSSKPDEVTVGSECMNGARLTYEMHKVRDKNA
eukprot:5268648-Prymnesium_polylepis.1